MGIFRRDETSEQRPAAATAGPVAAARTLIARGTRVEGLVGGGAEVEIEGEVRGEVRVDGVVAVGPDGVVEGPIAGRLVRVAGRVRGAVTASERVEVLGSGSLEGDVAAPRVTIVEGAYVKGKVEMGTQSQ
jgi:cytoskeletal protein CcmA (bactofilin family)